MRHNERGFSLIELLIVVAIILIIAAIAIPNLLKSRIAANEASAAASTRSLYTAEMQYAIANPERGYVSLAELRDAGFIDTLLASGDKSGYHFAVSLSSSSGTRRDQLAIGGDPQTAGTTGIRHFCLVEDGVLKYNHQSSIAARSACIAETHIAPN